MVAFTRNEIIPATQVVRKFASILDSLKKHASDKFAIVRNNEMQAVIIPIDEYERLVEAAERAEYEEIAGIISERKNTSPQKYVSFEKVLKHAGVSADEL